MKKEIYQNPNMNVIAIGKQDVIVTSTGTNNGTIADIPLGDDSNSNFGALH